MRTNKEEAENYLRYSEQEELIPGDANRHIARAQVYALLYLADKIGEKKKED